MNSKMGMLQEDATEAVHFLSNGTLPTEGHGPGLISDASAPMVFGETRSIARIDTGLFSQVGIPPSPSWKRAG